MTYDTKARARDLAIALNIVPDEARDSPEIRAIAAALDEARVAETQYLRDLVADFHWNLPMYDNDEATMVADDAAEEVKNQITAAIDARISALTAPPAETAL